MVLAASRPTRKLFRLANKLRQIVAATHFANTRTEHVDASRVQFIVHRLPSYDRQMDEATAPLLDSLTIAERATLAEMLGA